MRFAWGVVWVQRYRFPVIEPPHYYCCSGSLSVARSPCAKAEDPELAEDLACASAMLNSRKILPLRLPHDELAHAD